MKIISNVDSIFEKNLNKAKIAQVTLGKPVFEQPLSGKKEVTEKSVSKTVDPKYPADTVNERFTKIVMILSKNLLNLSYLSTARTGTDEMRSISEELEECRDTILGLQEDVNSLIPSK